MNQRDFAKIGIRGIVDEDFDGFVVSKVEPAISIIKQFTDCSNPDTLNMDQTFDLMVSIFESTFGSK